MATKGQLAKIWAGADEAGLEEAALRDLVAQVSSGRTRSTRELVAAEVDALIDSLVRLGARPLSGGRKPARPRAGRNGKPSGRRLPAGVTKLITPAQKKYIGDLRVKLGGDWVCDQYFEGACRKTIKRDHPTTAAEAAKMIQALRERLGWTPKGETRPA